jgi:hypothetical protein
MAILPMKTQQASIQRLLVISIAVSGTFDTRSRQKNQKPETIETWQSLQNIHKPQNIYGQIKR